jgi:hypothetical protein
MRWVVLGANSQILVVHAALMATPAKRDVSAHPRFLLRPRLLTRADPCRCGGPPLRPTIAGFNIERLSPAATCLKLDRTSLF